MTSLVKVPIAVATLERAARGELDPAELVTVEPGRVITPGPTGLSKFRHPAMLAVGPVTETEFQVGLRRFSMLLVYVAAALTVSIFAINMALDKPPAVSRSCSTTRPATRSSCSNLPDPPTRRSRADCRGSPHRRRLSE
ncbi:serine hydrolase [Catellatospora sp. NPDC049111]|uniref:serine hydrolase n=1 Tax=Catellatospora sp. NPDC049111 TaxID=3155271 RepID=UPI003410B291